MRLSRGWARPMQAPCRSRAGLPYTPMPASPSAGRPTTAHMPVPSSSTSARCQRQPVCVASAGAGLEPTTATDVEEIILPVQSQEALQEDSKWLSIQISTWLDEEWTPLDVHRQLGDAAGQAYVTSRVRGQDELGDVLLSVCSQLMKFDFHDTFTNAFEVGNKVSELLMLRQGCDVCCTSESDKARMVRVDDEMTARLSPPPSVADKGAA